MSECDLNDGDIAMMMAATAFVMLQTPAMGIAQAGMIRRKNALSMLMQTLSGLVFGSILFFAFGFSLVFGPSHGGLIGDGSYVFLSGVSPSKCLPAFSTSIPGLLYVSFQMMFAVMVPVIVTGAWAEKMTFKAFIAFCLLWPIFVYYPVAHWVWNPDGWIMALGVMDFAGGLTIHTSSGTAAFVAATYLQRREKLGERPQHHNMPLSILGGSLIWAGWYFFNGGSALKANAQAAVALLNTHLAGCAGALVWTALAYARDKHWHLSEIIGGAFAGLAAVTPGSGYVSPGSAIIIGILGGISSFYSSSFIKDRLRVDDVLDVTSLQGVAGAVGSLLVGVFADSAYQEGNPGADGLLISGSFELLGMQALALVIIVVWTAFFTNAIFYVMPRFFHPDVTAEVDEIGLDVDQIGERAYDEDLGLLLDSGLEGMAARLCEAASKGDFPDVKRLLFAGADAEGQDYDGRTPIALAASEGHLKIVKYLCDQHGANMNVEDRYRRTPLDDAIRFGHSACANWLLSRGATTGGGSDEEEGLGSDNDSQYTQLYSVFEASIAEHTTKLQYLLDTSPSNANAVDYDGRTPLHLACSEGKLASIRLLLAAGARLDCIDRWGLTPAEEAQRAGQHASAHFLASRVATTVKVGQADADRGDKRPATTSSVDYGSTSDGDGHGQIKLTRLPDNGTATGTGTGVATAVSPLLSMTDNPTTTTTSSTASTSLSSSAEIAAARSSPSPLTSSAGVRALCAAARKDDIDEIRRIFKKEPAVGGGADYDQRSALHVAASEGHIESVQELLKYPSVRVNATDRWKRTPLQDAVDIGNFAIVNLLRNYGASAVDEALAFRLCMAASKGDLVYIKHQVGLGKDVSVSDYDGRTCLHLAASEARIDIVEYLVSLGIRTDAVDRFGCTPADDTASTEIKRILNNAGNLG